MHIYSENAINEISDSESDNEKVIMKILQKTHVN